MPVLCKVPEDQTRSGALPARRWGPKPLGTQSGPRARLLLPGAGAATTGAQGDMLAGRVHYSRFGCSRGAA